MLASPLFPGPTTVMLADERSSMVDTSNIAKVLAKHLQKTVFDTRIQVRTGSGLLAERLDHEVAQALATNLAQLGHTCQLLDAADITALPRAKRVSRLALREDGLGLQIGYRWLPTIAPEQMLSLHAYAFSQELDLEDREDRRSLRSGVSVAGISEASEQARTMLWNMSKFEDKNPSRKIILCLDILTAEPVQVLRIEHDNFFYDALEDVKKGSVENFVTLLQLLKRRFDDNAAVKFLPSRTELMTREQTELKLYLLEKGEERDNANRWLIHRCLHGHLWEQSEDVADTAPGPELSLPPEFQSAPEQEG